MSESGLSFVFFFMIQQQPRSTLSGSSAASEVYKGQDFEKVISDFLSSLPEEAKKPA